MLIGQLDTWRESNVRMEGEQVELMGELDRLAEVSGESMREVVDL